jgi:hypothetical protein
MNMSYCRFQNTLGDLGACQDALADLLDENRGKLSREELAAAGDLIEVCAAIVLHVTEACAEDDIDAILMRDWHRGLLAQANDEASED